MAALRTRFTPLLIGLLALILVYCGCGSDSPSRTPAVDLPREDAAAVVREVADVGVSPDDLSCELGPSEISLNWTSLLNGDYNVDGAVTGLDVFPLAAHFDESSSEKPGNECIDGNGDDTLNGQDLFLIAVNFQDETDWEDVFTDNRPDGEFDGEPVNSPQIAYAGCGAQQTYIYAEALGVQPVYFAIRAGSGDPSTYSAIGNVSWPEGAPAAPAGVTANWNIEGYVQLEWPLNSEFDIAGYNIYRGDTSGGAKDKLNPIPLTAQPYQDDTVSAGETWYYQVTAVDLYGEESDPCDEIEVICTSEAGWTLETLDPAKFAQFLSMKYNSEGNAGIAFHHRIGLGQGNLYFAWEDSGLWTIDLVDDGTYVGMECDMAWDLNGRPVISYRDGSQGLAVARYDGSDWSSTIVDSTSSAGWYSSVLTSQMADVIAVSHHVGMPDYDFKMAAWDGSSWTNEIVESGEEQYGAFSEMAQPSNPLQWGVLYHDSTNHHPRYGFFNGMSLNIETVNMGPYFAAYTLPLIYDADDHPAFTCQDAFEYSLIYAHHNGASWDFEVVDNPANYVANDSDLEFDKDGNPVIAYRDSTDQDLKVAWFNGTTWDIEIVDAEGYTGYAISMDLDSGGNPVIAYGGQNFLKLARWRP